MLNTSEPTKRARRLPGGLGLRYSPPEPGDKPPLHVLSLSRSGVEPSDTELRTVYDHLTRVRPAAKKAMYTKARNFDHYIRRITWREE